MKYSSLLIVALLKSTAYAADPNEKQNLRRTVESHPLEHPNKAPHKHQPRGAKSSGTVTYFTMGGKTNMKEKKEKKGSNHDGDDGRENRIVGGSQSDPGEFPYYVDLGGCGGSLIAPNVVLTAAHCGSYQGESVVVGAYRYDSTANNAVRVSVSADIQHPNYDDFTTANDFRLLRLSQDVTIGGSNVVLSINDQSSRPSNGQDLTVLGLGTTSEDGNDANILRDVVVQAIPTSTCNQPISYGGDVEDNMFCAGVNGGGKDSCQGDSGGPIVIRNGNQHVQVGVVSWGDGCARPNKPGVYARVSSAYGWIEQVVCDQWNINADFCGGGTPTPPSPTPPSPTPPSPTPPSPTPPSPTPPSGGGCPTGEMEFDFTIRTDEYGWETSWEAARSSGSKVASGANYESNRTYRKNKCIPEGCYTLAIFDDYGDGLGSDGNYELKVNGQVVESKSGFDFGYERSIDFGSCSGGGDSGGGSGGGSSGGSGSGSSCMPITLNLRTDDWGYETDLFLLTDTGELVWNANGFADNKDYQFSTCLDSSECATLDIFDEWGDGIESPGYIKLVVDGTTYFNGGDIGGGIVFRIGGSC